VPAIGPIQRKDLIYYLRQLRFEGPFSGKRHQVMVRGNLKLPIPNPHQGDISKALLLAILKEAKVSREDWKQL
jgi:hypothetical protein